jgi:hypothetical protein
VIASEFKTLSEEGSSLDEVTINLDWGDNSDCHRTLDIISFQYKIILHERIYMVHSFAICHFKTINSV